VALLRTWSETLRPGDFCYNALTVVCTHILQGICIEPIEFVSSRRAMSYSGAICDPAKAGTSVIFDLSLGGLHGIAEHMKLNKIAGGARVHGHRSIKCLSLPALLDANEIVHVGYMTVDTEGSEFVFLKSFDFVKYRVDVLQVECNDLQCIAEIATWVEANLGMKLTVLQRFWSRCDANLVRKPCVSHTGGDMIFVAPNLLPPTSPLLHHNLSLLLTHTATS
jgi:hypothetical protein